MSLALHLPVLLQATVSGLALRPGTAVVDGTVGDGGHAEAILEATAPDGRLLGLDLDPDALKTAGVRLQRFGPRVILRQGNFRDMAKQVRNARFPEPDAILLDLGLRSFEIEASGRGFSFRRDEPLDMRFDPDSSPTAAEIVNRWPRPELVRILRSWGEERRADRIADRIVTNRRRKPIRTTAELVAVIGGPFGRIDPATRTFQALRIAVNDELGALREGLREGFPLLRTNGRLAVISFHSLEDRIVKQSFLALARTGRGRIVTKRPLIPVAAEIAANPRSRSAKLRIIERL